MNVFSGPTDPPDLSESGGYTPNQNERRESETSRALEPLEVDFKRPRGDVGVWDGLRLVLALLN